MVAAALTACGHRASQQNAEGTAASEDQALSASAELTTDSIGLEREDSMVSVKVSIDWPTGSNQQLVNGIRQYICEELSSSIDQESKPEVKVFDDGKTAVEATVKRQYDDLAGMWKESKENGMPMDMTYSYFLHVFKMEETERYITYLSKSEGFLGGAHGYATATGITFSKKDGRRIGYQTEYNREKDTFEMKYQTLFNNPKADGLAQLIKEGVRSYFQGFDTEETTDEQLKDMLIGVDDINKIPLPVNSPLFTKEGLSFTYQQYEIAPYAAGMINFDIPYEKVKPFLTEEATDLIK
jgi:hypothetical protein